MANDESMMKSQQNFLELATSLAAQGKYDDALDMLDRITESEFALSVALLRAKLHAQRSEYGQALQAWEKAVAIDPENREAQRGLRRNRKLLDAEGSRLVSRVRFYCGGLIVLLVLMMTLIAYLLTSNRLPDAAAEHVADRELREKELQVTRQMAEAMQARYEASERHSQRMIQEMHHAKETLRSMNAALAAEVEEQSTALRKLEQRVDLLNGRQDQYRSEMATAQERVMEQFDKHYRLFEQHSKILEELNRQQDEFPAMVENALTKVSEPLLRQVSRELSDADQRMARIETLTDRHGREIAAISENMANERAAQDVGLTAIQNALKSVQGDIGDLDRSLNAEILDVKGVLRYFLDVSMPTGTIVYPERIHELQAEIETIRAELQHVESGRLLSWRPLRQRRQINRLQARSNELQRLRRAYDNDVLPWLEALEYVDTKTGDRLEERHVEP